MNIDAMRRIDYYGGIPLCAMATVWTKLLGRFRRPGPSRPGRVLFLELSEMGSAILADPAMRKLQAAGTVLFFVIFRQNAPSLRLLGTVPEENVFTIRTGSLPALVWDSLRFLVWCRKQVIDTTIDLELFSRYTALLSGLSGAGRRVGFHSFHNEGLYRGDLLTHKVAYNPHLHIAKNFVALANAALADRHEVPFSKTVISDEEVKLARRHLGEPERARMRERVSALYPEYDPRRHRLVLINPNASELLPQRRWQPDRYAELSRRILAEYPDAIVLITGAPAEREEAEALRLAVGESRCINFAGEVRFEELPLLYGISACMITNDSGPGHFASVTDMPTVVLFGPETPRLYGALGNNSTPIYAGLACSPCVGAANHRKTPCRDNACLQAILPDQVFSAVDRIMGAAPAREYCRPVQAGRSSPLSPPQPLSLHLLQAEGGCVKSTIPSKGEGLMDEQLGERK